MKLLNYKKLDLKRLGAYNTASEIAGQNTLWNKIFDKFIVQIEDIKCFIKSTMPQIKRIILTGAGTSAYIGLSLQAAFYREFGIITMAIPTTDLVSHPNNYFTAEEPILLVSFARSGNSPESMAVVELADKLVNNCFHLIITCDILGQLANYHTIESKSFSLQKYIFILPQESNDKGLAMTGSYSGMLLVGFLIANIFNTEDMRKQVQTISNYGQAVIKNYATKLQEISKYNFKRAVFLGSGPQFGTATESNLKLQELTNGEVICKNETFLGFRHGPKAVINEDTIVIYLFSNDEYVLKYELDLVHTMNIGKKPLFQIGISETPIMNIDVDLQIVHNDKEKLLVEELLSICNIIPAQILGFYKSLNLELSPDNPSETGAINRVVQGVKIYSF